MFALRRADRLLRIQNQATGETASCVLRNAEDGGTISRT